MKTLLLTCATLLLVSGTATAQERTTINTVVLAPVSSLGDSSDKSLLALEKTLEVGLAAVPEMTVISARVATKRARKAKRPELRTCEGDAPCLAQLGVLLSAQLVVYAEVGGLGDAQVVYLKLVEVSTGKEVRSTTLQLSAETDASQASKGAAIRLLAPQLYVGTLGVSSLISGAIAYLDGHKVATTPTGPIKVFVGSHALRVTHPEHQDFVRFVDIEFGKETTVNADLKMLPGVQQRLSREGIIEDPNAKAARLAAQNRGGSPWYYRWYSITGGAVVIAVGSAIILSAVSNDIDADIVRDL